MAEAELSDVEISRLFDCATSSKYGLVDRGFPGTFKRLAPLGFVKQINGGYVITELGLAYLKANKEKFFLSKTKKKKRKKRSEDEDFNNEGES